MPLCSLTNNRLSQQFESIYYTVQLLGTATAFLNIPSADSPHSNPDSRGECTGQTRSSTADIRGGRKGCQFPWTGASGPELPGCWDLTRVLYKSVEVFTEWAFWPQTAGSMQRPLVHVLSFSETRFAYFLWKLAKNKNLTLFKFQFSFENASIVF